MKMHDIISSITVQQGNPSPHAGRVLKSCSFVPVLTVAKWNNDISMTLLRNKKKEKVDKTKQRVSSYVMSTAAYVNLWQLCQRRKEEVLQAINDDLNPVSPSTSIIIN